MTNNEAERPAAEERRSGKGFPALSALRDRIAGSLYGGALGDALGYEVEFESWDSIQDRFGRGGIRKPVLHQGKALVSDDTQMTLFTAEGMALGYFRAAGRGEEVRTAESIHQAYLCWLQTQGYSVPSRWDGDSRLRKRPDLNHRRAPGNTCLSALKSGNMGTIEDPINHSKGCGGVMRTAPLGFVRQAKNGRSPFGCALRCGAEAAAITHGHPLGWLPAGMLSDMVDRCLYEDYGSLRELTEASLAETVRTFSEYEEIGYFEKLMSRAISLAAEPAAGECGIYSVDEPAIRSLGEGWVGEEALAIAVYAVLRYPGDMEMALRAAVNHSGDSDSTGAIAGNILGAYLGAGRLPEAWVSHLELGDAVEELTDGMLRIIEDRWHK